jgi:hypothetical protein
LPYITVEIEIFRFSSRRQHEIFFLFLSFSLPSKCHRSSVNKEEEEETSSLEEVKSPTKIFEIRMVLYLKTFLISVLATQSIANVVKSSLGPVGLDKMLVDDIGVRLLTYNTYDRM